MQQFIEVTHVNGTWRLELLGCQPNLYLSGGRAEADARQLARSLALAGCDTRVQVHDKQHVLIADHHFFAG